MTSIPPRDGSTRRVLIIDDSNFDRRVLLARLRGEDVELLEARDGPTGLRWAREARPDLILLDVRMEGWDGFETVRHLKDDPGTRSIPVIFLSACSSTAEKARGLDLGAVDFVTKPFDSVELLARVRAALRTKLTQDLLEQRAHLDGLTGLGNRHAMEERLAADWEWCRAGGRSLSILIADLDHFKRVNDEHGHNAGDEALRRAAGILRQSVRSGDFVARYGGEEFAVIAPDCDLEGALGMAERFRADLCAHAVSSRGRRIALTTSVGVAWTSPAGNDRIPALFEDADRSLYCAKSSGRNAVWLWDPELGCPRYASPKDCDAAV